MFSRVPTIVFCCPTVPRRTSATGRSVRATVRQHFAGDRSQSIHAHQHHLGAAQFRQRIEVDRAFPLRRILVTGEKSDVRILAAMSYRNSGIGRRRNGGRNAGTTSKSIPAAASASRFFAPASENKWIASLQPHDIFSETRFFDQERVDFILRKRFLASTLSGENDFGVNRGPAPAFPD